MIPNSRRFRIRRAVPGVGTYCCAGLATIAALATICVHADDDHKQAAREESIASPTAVQLDRLDTDLQSWTTELVSDAAKHELIHLSEAIERAGEISIERLSEVLAADISCTVLRPTNLQVVFEDPMFVVHRPPEQSGDSRSTVAGLPGIVAALQDLTRPFAQSSEIRIANKVYQVEISDGMATTRSFYQASGTTPDGRLQQNAVWRCSWTLPGDGSHPRLTSIVCEHYEEIHLRQRDPLFSDRTAAVLGQNASFREQLMHGIDYWRSRIEMSRGIEVLGHQGLAVSDVNGDGLDDLYVCQPGGLPNRLFVQRPDGTAHDESADAGIDWLDRTSAALFVDLDNDADQDLVMATDYHVVFLQNDGRGRFGIIGGVPTTSIPRSLSAVDYDNDGLLDVYVCFASPAVSSTQRERSLPMPIHDANNGAPNALLRNEGNFRFRDVAVETGLSQNNSRFSWAAAWEDFDNDGDQDLYVANDFGRNNLYRNDAGKFTDIAAAVGVEDSATGMSVSWGDYDGDGWMDLYVGNMYSAAGNRIAYQRRFHQHVDDETRQTFQRHARGNSLFRNVNGAAFEDQSIPADVAMGRWAWGSLFADVNNDGRQDLLVANGYVTQHDTDDL